MDQLGYNANVSPVPDTRQYSMRLHLLTISTFEPHPLAREEELIWPEPLSRPRVVLGFQICDDGLYVLKHNMSGPSPGRLCGWQWTTGRLGVVSCA